MIFNFPFHKFSTEYPDSSFRLRMGNSYQYSAPPPAPDQRIFKLKFRALKYFTNAQGIDRNAYPEINLALLEDFYNLHKTHSTFTYPHPVYGNLVCSFNKPLSIPEGLEDGNGVVQDIELEFIERPGSQDTPDTDLIQISYEDLP